VRTDLSCTVFLSDPDDYDGGELVVQDTYGSPRIKLPAGHAVLYPGTSVHRSSRSRAACGWPASSGSRAWCAATSSAACCSTWTCLMRLRQRDGETDEAVALTGTYHNLLRLWADT
jgi:PKHD-type hydroxylase